MASVYRRRRTHDGHTYREPTWTLKYRLARRQQTKGGFRDAAAAWEYWRIIERRSQLARLGLADVIDIAETFLDDLLARYREHLTASGVTQGHIRDTVTRIRHILDTASWTHIAQMTPRSIESALLALRTASRYSHRTANAHLVSLKSWLQYLVDTDVLVRSPARTVRSIPSIPSIRRRALTIDEFQRLIVASHRGPIIMGTPGIDRGRIYCLAAYCGLRRSEIEQLTPVHFDTTGPIMTILFAVGRTKNRRRSVIIIPTWLASEFRPWLSTLAHGAPCFPGWGLVRSAEMLRHDLRAADIPDEFRGETVDFHALRSCLATC